MKMTVIAVLGLFVVQAAPLLGQAEAVRFCGQKETVSTGGSGPETSSDKGANPNRAGELIISSGDLLQVSLFGTDFSCGSEKAGCEVRVSGSGDIVLPLAGELKVGGLTVAQAEQMIAARFSKGGFFNDPQVMVVQKEYATQGISILGEVQKPGTYSLLGSHSLLQAVSMAGGTTPKAGNDVTIIHTDAPNQPQHCDLRSAGSGSVALMPGDTIVISKAGIVYVVGDVHQPTGVVMENSGLTVLQAIAMAQGTNPTAALDKAKLIRNTADSRTEIPVPLKKILSNKSEDLKLQPEDILFVPSSAAKSASRRSIEAILQAATGVAIYGRF
jgi:polysaccharide biosynthesis/export protein